MNHLCTAAAAQLVRGGDLHIPILDEAICSISRAGFATCVWAVSRHFRSVRFYFYPRASAGQGNVGIGGRDLADKLGEVAARYINQCIKEKVSTLWDVVKLLDKACLFVSDWTGH